MNQESDQQLTGEQLHAEIQTQQKMMRRTLEFQRRFIDEISEYAEYNAILVQNKQKEVEEAQMINEAQISSRQELAKIFLHEKEKSMHLKAELEQKKSRQQSAMRLVIQARDQAFAVRDRVNEDFLRTQRQKQQLLEQLQLVRAKKKKIREDNQKLKTGIVMAQKKKVEMKEGICEANAIRKDLNNQLQNLRGNIRVYCRIRPFLPHEQVEQVYNIIEDSTLKLFVPKEIIKSENQQKEYTYNFEQIFDQNESQLQVFGELSQLISNAVDGRKVCIFAYGQTGSGKTYTMFGGAQENQAGIIPRSVDLIFEEIEKAKKFEERYEVRVSVEEIYINSVKDLLSEGQPQGEEGNSIPVKNPQELKFYMNKAMKNRKVAGTNCNQHSSRSHLIFTIRLKSTVNLEDKQIIKQGSLTLVDLAGNENSNKSGVVGEQLKETNAINLSLTDLGRVITAMGTKNAVVPYRNCKLTTVLKPFLQGASKTLMFVNLSPRVIDFNQSLQSLRFAQNVKSCTMKK